MAMVKEMEMPSQTITVAHGRPMEQRKVGIIHKMVYYFFECFDVEKACRTTRLLC